MPAPIIIDNTLADYISGPVAIMLSAVDEQNRPHLVRIAGCKVADGGEALVLFADRRKSEVILAAAQARDFIAAVFCLPGPEQAMQIKGDSVMIRPPNEEEIAFQLGYRQAWVNHLVSLGYNAAFSQAIVDWPLADLVAIRFRPLAVFEQTPGPQAGTSLAGVLP